MPSKHRDIGLIIASNIGAVMATGMFFVIVKKLGG